MLAVLCHIVIAAPSKKWTEAQANSWYQNQPWLIGSNYIPATAINELEMWQADTFDPERIDKELGWARSIGMNTMRVFLHDLVWKQDPEGFKRRLDTFLRISAKHRIKPMFVLFDSCWDPSPSFRKTTRASTRCSQFRLDAESRSTRTGRSFEYSRLEQYVKGVVGAFAHDSRILAWDIWNEPDNTNGGSYAKLEPRKKVEIVLGLLPQAFAWAREAGPQQPLTSGIWKGDWSSNDQMDPMDRLQIYLSDVISFHNYDAGEEFEKRVKWLDTL